MDDYSRPDTYDFPTDENVATMLFWLGDDYLATLLDDLQAGFRKQDPGSELLAVRCQERPRFLTAVRKGTDEITGMMVTFPLQILVRDGAGYAWRLFATMRYEGEALDTDRPSILHQVDIERSEPASGGGGGSEGGNGPADSHPPARR